MNLLFFQVYSISHILDGNNQLAVEIVRGEVELENPSLELDLVYFLVIHLNY